MLLLNDKYSMRDLICDVYLFWVRHSFVAVINCKTQRFGLVTAMFQRHN